MHVLEKETEVLCSIPEWDNDCHFIVRKTIRRVISATGLQSSCKLSFKCFLGYCHFGHVRPTNCENKLDINGAKKIMNFSQGTLI